MVKTNLSVAHLNESKSKNSQRAPWAPPEGADGDNIARSSQSHAYRAAMRGKDDGSDDEGAGDLVVWTAGDVYGTVWETASHKALKMKCERLRCRLVLEEARTPATFLASEIARLTHHLTELGYDSARSVGRLHHMYASGQLASGKEKKAGRIDEDRRQAGRLQQLMAGFCMEPIQSIKQSAAYVLQSFVRAQLRNVRMAGSRAKRAEGSGYKGRLENLPMIIKLQARARRWLAKSKAKKTAEELRRRDVGRLKATRAAKKQLPVDRRTSQELAFAQTKFGKERALKQKHKAVQAALSAKKKEHFAKLTLNRKTEAQKKHEEARMNRMVSSSLWQALDKHGADRD